MRKVVRVFAGAAVVAAVLFGTGCAIGLTPSRLVVALAEDGSRALTPIESLMNNFINPGDGLYIRVESLESAWSNQTVRTTPPFRFETDLPEGQSLFRVVAYAATGYGNSYLAMDQKIVNVRSQDGPVNVRLRLGHMITYVNSENITLPTFVCHQHLFELDYPQANDTLTLYTDPLHSETLTSFSYRLNDGPWQTVAVSGTSAEIDVAYTMGRNVLRFRYFQESDGQPIVYTYVVNRTN